MYAAGMWWDLNGNIPVRRWSAGGRGIYTDVPVAHSTVTDLLSLPDGRVVFAVTGGSPGWGVISKQGHCIKACGQVAPRHLDRGPVRFSRPPLSDTEILKIPIHSDSPDRSPALHPTRPRLSDTVTHKIPIPQRQEVMQAGRSNAAGEKPQPVRATPPPDGPATPGLGDTVTHEIPIHQGQELMQLASSNRYGEQSKSEPPMAMSTPPERPALHVLAVGVTNYRDHSLAEGVPFAAGDAAAVKALFQSHGGSLYRSVEVRDLVDEQATRANIEREMRGVARLVGPHDVFVLYLAGHGAVFEGNFHFIPWDALYTSQQDLRAQSIDHDTLRDLLAGIVAGRTLVLLDTGASGMFGYEEGRILDYKKAFTRFSLLTRRALIAAAADDRMAREGEGGHGVFTFALLEGLGGAADRDRDRTVRTGELADYIEQTIPEITRRKWNREQFPYRDLQGHSFPILKAPEP